MNSFLLEQIAFYLTIPIVFFIPGYFLLLAVFGKKSFSLLEKFALAFSSSIIAINFLMIFIGRFDIPITRASLLAVIILFCAFCYFIYHKKHKSNSIHEKIVENHFSKRELIAILAILILTIFIKTTYLSNAILPTPTDLGHHMYWTKTIVTSGKLPVYAKSDIIDDLSIGQPTSIADFIIGEHLALAATSLISGLEVISYFPVLILYLVHIMAIITLFILTLLIFKDFPRKNLIAISALFLLGPIYALSSPQMKFVSGGVIGNTIGNLLIPFAIYFFVRALNEKSSKLLAFALFAGLGLAYTHHLSAFVFIFVFFFTFVIFAVVNFRQMRQHLQTWFKMLISPEILAVLAMGIVFIFFMYTPTYLNVKAVDTAVGAPSKATRMGLTFTQLKFTAGEARFAFGLLAIALLAMLRKRLTYGTFFLLGWGIALTFMSLRPDWMLVDIPSNRIASYIIYPMAILSSYAFVMIISNIKNGKQYISSSFVITSLLMLLAFAAVSGYYDNSQTLNLDSDPKKALQTFNASAYLAKTSDNSDMILKDHNYISADSWIKTFFMRGYNYPLSRGYFKRYDDTTKKREQCTNLMISQLNTPEAQQCFAKTKTDFLMINPKYDAAQFQKSSNFWQVYSADDVSIFYKKS